MAIPKAGKIALLLMLFYFPLAAQTQKSASIKDSNSNINDSRKSGIPTNASQNSPQKQTFVRRYDFFKTRHTKEQKRLLLPDEKDLNLYANFLKQPKTGLIKLVDNFECDTNLYVIRVDKECLNTIPGGSFYSFRERRYSSSALADLRLKEGLLISDGVLSQNILVKLGNTPLENVSLESSGMKFLTTFIPAADIKEATKQYIEITKGIKAENFEYYKVIPAAINTTYAMRLIAFRGKVPVRFYRGVYDALFGDNRADIIVAFRIIRKENDEITLLWKELERKKSPKIVKSKY